jgi:hypothetical protein
MFTRGSNLHHVQLPITPVRSNGERQATIQMVTPRSKNHEFPQEAALTLRTYALAVQSSYGRKVKSLKVRDLVNGAVAEYGGGNFHRKMFVSILEIECDNYQGAP